jgi:alkanesulfonate monooxygenase SsuD/methylene tetrahydromethanopterin reductase-like flavin-dependent oxidoreductase (luciferase family)
MQIHGDRIRVGVHSGQLHGSYDICLDLWLRAEQLGYEWVSLVDHFRPSSYPPDWPCFEGTTLLAALAARTSTIRCALLVSAVTWRHPAIVANIASTIDHVSDGRLELGIGAAGPDRAYGQYGIPFPDNPVRLEMLDEACTIVRSLWTRDVVTFHGRHFTLNEARLAPKPVQRHLPLVIGGDGVRRTLRIVARHADIWNALVTDTAAYRHKLDALGTHCAAVGRDADDVRKSITFRTVLAETNAAAQHRARDQLAFAPDDVRSEYLVFGTPEQCLAKLRPFTDLGVRDFLLAVKAPIDWLTVELFATQVAPHLHAAPTDRSTRGAR